MPFKFFKKKSESVNSTVSVPATSLSTSQHDNSNNFDYGLHIFFEPTLVTFEQVIPSEHQNLMINKSGSVLFVHGLGGHWRETWRNSQAQQPWPQAWLPDKLENARILSWGFDSHVSDWKRIVSQNAVTDHANSLLRDLSNHRDNDNTNDQPIFFVTHSLGGLVCIDALLRSRNSPDDHIHQIILCTRGVIFLGTPHSGTDALASWAKGLATALGILKQTNPDILEVLKRDSELLYRIQTEFHTMIRNRRKNNETDIDIICFFEELAMPGIGVIVTRESATLPTYRSTGLAYNHSEMTRFRAADETAFLAVVAELRRWSKSLRPSPDGISVPISGSSTEGMMANDSAIDCFPTIPHFPYSRNASFVGCTDILMRIEMLFSNHSSVALNGIGGVGKTEIATEYCYRVWGRHPRTSVFWIPCDDMTQIELAFSDIADILRLPGQDDPDADKIQLVARHFCRRDAPPWLIVLDNFDDSELLTKGKSKLAEFIPRYRGGQVLITTRDSHVAQILTGSSNSCLTIDRLPPGDAQALFRSKLPYKTEFDEATELQILEVLEYLPLCITQAAAYVDRSNISLSEYLLELTESEGSLLEALSEEQVDIRRGIGSPNSVLRTWKLSFDKIRARYSQAGNLLCVMAYLDRHDIPREMLVRAVESRHQLNNALGILQGFCLIAVDSSKTCFKMHRLVQLATRFWLFAKKSDYETLALRLVASSLGDSDDENRERQAQLLPHAKSVEKYAFQGREENLILANVQHSIAKFEFHAGRYDSGAGFCWEALVKQQELLGESNLATIHSSGLLGVLRRYQGRYEDALALQKGALLQKEFLLGADDSDTIDTVQDLSDVLERQGKFASSEVYAQRVFAGRQRESGLLHPKTLQSQMHLALLMRRQAKYKDAERLGRDVLEKNLKTLPSGHEATLRAAYALAGTLRETGQYSEAVNLSEMVREGRVKLFGDDHPQTLLAINNLALGYRLKGNSKQEDNSRQEDNLKKAEDLYRHVCSVHEKAGRNDFPDLLQAYQNLAVVLREQGKYAEAEVVGRDTLVRRDKALGHEHLSTINTANELAMTLELRGLYSEAESLALRALAVRTKKLGPSHTYTLDTKFVLGSLREKHGFSEEAQALFKEVLQDRIQVLGPEHPDTKEVSRRLESISTAAVIKEPILLGMEELGA